MERDRSFWITSSEHQGTMPKRIFSFSCSMQVIQFADLQFHLIKYSIGRNLILKYCPRKIFYIKNNLPERTLWRTK
jgi:hypothetical protein